MSDITLINDSEQSQLVTNGLAVNGELYLKKEGSTDAGSVVVYDSGSWRTFANEAVAGLVNTYSVDLDGTNDYLSITQDSAINITGNITLSAWVYRDNSGGFNAVFTKRQVGGSMNYQLIINNSTKRIGLGHSGGAWVYNTSTTIEAGAWYHVAVTVSGSTAQFYVNGVAGDSFTGVSISATTHNLIIGATVGYNYFDGKIDEAAIFNSALSSSHILTMYNDGAPHDLTPMNPVGWWRMGDNDSGTGSTITDQGSGGNDATLINGPTFSTDVPS